MTIRPITDADRQPRSVRHLFGTTQSGMAVNEVRMWVPTGQITGIWLSTTSSGISMPLLATHVVETNK